MSADVIIAWIVRIIHIGSATAAIGAPIFVRFALMPAAAKALDEASHQKLRDAINARWRHIVYLLITLFILTGLYNFLVPVRVDGVLITARWKDFSPDDRKLYHMIFGFKMIAAFGMFFLASALAGRSSLFIPMRRKSRIFVTILLLLAVVVLVCATMMRILPLQR